MHRFTLLSLPLLIPAFLLSMLFQFAASAAQPADALSGGAAVEMAAAGDLPTQALPEPDIPQPVNAMATGGMTFALANNSQEDSGWEKTNTAEKEEYEASLARIQSRARQLAALEVLETRDMAALFNRPIPASEPELPEKVPSIYIRPSQANLERLPLATQGTGTISGRVTAAADGTPLENVHVQATTYDDESFWAEAWTDPQGYYTITDLFAGDFRLRVDDEGGIPAGYAIQYYPYTYIYSAAGRVNLPADDSVVIDINFALEPGGTLTGMVVDQASGLPLENLNVNLNLPDAGFGYCTDASGVFQTEHAPYGEYQVAAGGSWNWCQSQSGIYARQFYDHVAYPWEAASLTLDALNNSISGLDFDLEIGAVIQGRVTAASDGTPLENVHIAATPYDDEWDWFHGWSDAQGYYTITALTPSEYRLRIDDEDGTPDGYAFQYYSQTFDHGAAERVLVSDYSDHLTGYNFFLEPGGAITGVVVDQASSLPLANTNIWLELSTGGGWGGCTDNDGRFAPGHLPYGEYRASAGGDWNWCLGLQSEYARQYYDHVYDPNQATLLTLDADHNPLANIDFDLQTGAVIKGRVTSAANGAPLADVKVQAEVYDDNWYRADGWSDPQGYYTITGLVPADYRLKVDDTNWIPDGYAIQYYPYTFAHHLAERVTLNDFSDQLDGYDFALEPGGVITGVVVDQGSGLPLANHQVQADIQTDEGGGVGTCTDANGQYQLRGAIYGDYHVRSGGEWDWCQQQPSPYIREYYQETMLWDLAAQLTLDAGSPLITDINLSLELGGQISGRVIARDTGLPLVNVHVSASSYDDEWYWGDGWTDADGYYTTGGVPAGDYRVRVDDTNWIPAPYLVQYYPDTFFYQDAGRVSLPPLGSLGNIDFHLDPGGYLSGTVWQDSIGGPPVGGIEVRTAYPRPDWCTGCYDAWLSTETDANGSYQVGPLPSLPIALLASADNANLPLVNEFYGDVYALMDATLITPTAGATLPDLNFVLAEGVLLRGTVSVPAGYSPEGVNIDVWTWENQYEGHRQTAPDGSYTIPVPPLYDQRWGLGSFPWNTDLGMQQADNFDLSRIQSFDFDLPHGGVITGVVTHLGVPVPNVQVNANDNHLGNGSQTDANGVFTITNLPPSTYRVEANGYPNYFRAFVGGHDWDWADFIPLAEGETLSELQIELPRLGILEGHVYASDGVTPIAGATINALTNDGYWSGNSQMDGYFSLDVPADNLKVFFSADGYRIRYYPDDFTFADAPWVSVPPYGSGTADITMLMTPMASLSGQVTDAASGDPLGGIHVAAYLNDPSKPRDDAWWSCTDENGDYLIEYMEPGQVELIVQGTCGNNQYPVYTQSLALAPGATLVKNIQLHSAAPPPRPFTLRADDSFDYTPLAGSQGVGLTNADQILPALFAPLVQLDDQGQWYSDLLTQVPTTANGGAAMVNGRLVVTYTLKSGLLWSDGVPLTSEDIRFAWEMSTAPYPWYDTYRAQMGIPHKVESIATPDAQTAVLTFKHGQIPPAYLNAVIYPLPSHVLNGQHVFDLVYLSDYAHHPVGNGPYIVANWSPGSHLDLVANPNYHKRSLGYPKTNQLRILFTGHPFYSLLDMADVSLNMNDYIPADYDTFDLNVRVSTGMGFNSIDLNGTRPFFAETAVRQALSYALNRQGWIDQNNLIAEPGYSWLPPRHPLYTAGTIHKYPYNLATAASLLDSAGWVDHNGDGVRDKNGVEFSFTLAFRDTDALHQKLYAMFQTDLASIGVDVNLVAMEWDELLDRGIKSELDAYAVGWYFDNNFDPMGFDLFHSSKIPTPYNSYYQGMHHTGWWSDPANDALLEAAHQELDPSILKSLYASQVDLWTQETPILVTNYNTRYDGARPTVLNLKPAQHTPVTWNIEQWYKPANPYDLSVRKALAADSPAAKPGNDLIYEITVRNAGFFPVTGSTLVDTLPPEVQFVSASPAPSSVSSGVATWDLGEISGGSVLPAVRLRVHIPDTVPHATVLRNTAQVYGDQSDTYPANNLYQHQVEVRDDIDLAVTKTGVGLPAVGERFTYYLDYANWGGAPASGAVLTDTLPDEVTFLSADPAPSAVNGQALSWDLPTLNGGQYGGQVEIEAEINAAGTVVNTGSLHSGDPDINLANNTDNHVENVNSILAPVILRPTQGTTDRTPTVSGLAPAGSTVAIYDLTSSVLARDMRLGYQPQAALLGTTTADVNGTFSYELTMAAEGAFSLAATAEKSGLTSGYSNSATIVVDFDLDLDPDTITIQASGVDFSAGAVRAERYASAFRILDVESVVACPVQPNGRLKITENGVLNYNVNTLVSLESAPDQWRLAAQFWLAEPHSTYDVWLEWTCNGTTYQELLLYVLIDPDGYLYDAAQVSAGSTITDSLLVNGVITAFVKTGDTWQIWPADFYGQFNPQSTDAAVADGVTEPGYYSFLTPPGVYRIEASAPGYQPYQSPVLTVINTPIHLDIGLEPVVAGSGINLTPVNLSASGKTVDKNLAWLGDELSYNIILNNTGDEASGALRLEDSIPARTAYVPGSLSWDTGLGSAGYEESTGVIWWEGSLPGQTSLNLSYRLQVVSTPGTPFSVVNTSQVSGPAANLLSLPSLSATTLVQNQVGVALQADSTKVGNPGDTVAFTHRITNTGNTVDTFSFTTQGNVPWTLTSPADKTLAAGASATVQFDVDIPVGVAAGLEARFWLTATSQTAPARIASLQDSLTVNQIAGLALSPDQASTGVPGETITFTHTITNHGNAADTFHFSVQSPAGWTYRIGSDLNLTAGETGNIWLAVTIPTNTPDKTQVDWTLNAASTNDPSVAEMIKDRVTVVYTSFKIMLPVVLK